MTDARAMRVLVAEDDPYFQKVLEKRLSAEGYAVHSVKDGRDGLQAIVSWEPDLVISDWMMPEVDGLELCQSVKTGLRENAPYFILLTARGELNDRVLGLETGADDYLVKPCDQAELLARVRAGLRIVALTRQLRQAVADLRVTQDDLARTQQNTLRLHGLIAICSVCKKARTEDDHWQDIDHYLAERAQADFTHGICPDCRATHYPPPQRRAGGE